MIEFSGWLQLWWQDHPVPPYADCHCTCCQAHQKASQMPTDKVSRAFSLVLHIISCPCYGVCHNVCAPLCISQVATSQSMKSSGSWVPEP